MREIIFDTETTGLDSRTDRIIEIGGVELFNHFPTGRTFHMYVNPAGQKVHPDALAVHGITDEFLADKPPFADVAGPMLEFFGDAKWIAHNANFDMGFINAELARLGMPSILPEMVIDTLSLARRKNPMGRILSMPSAAVMASTIPTAPSTARCSTRNCWPKSISR